MTQENITALTAATSGYKFQIALETALNKEQLDALDYEAIGKEADIYQLYEFVLYNKERRGFEEE